MIRRSRNTQMGAVGGSGYFLVVLSLMLLGVPAFAWGPSTHNSLTQNIFDDAEISGFLTEFNIDRVAIENGSDDLDIDKNNGWDVFHTQQWGMVYNREYADTTSKWFTTSGMDETRRLKYMMHNLMDVGVPLNHAPANAVYSNSTAEMWLEAQVETWTTYPTDTMTTYTGTMATQPGTMSQVVSQFRADVLANATWLKSTGTNIFGSHGTANNSTAGWNGTWQSIKLSKAVLTDYFLAKRDVIADAGTDYSVNPGGSVTMTTIAQDPDSITWASNGTYTNNGGGIVGYAWDMDNEGTFSPYSSSSSVTFTHQQLVNVCGYNEDGNTFAVRVIDDEGKTSTDTALVKVFSDPISDAGSGYAVTPGNSVTLNSSASYDPDSVNAGNGSGIVGYAWDLDNDGNFSPDNSSSIVTLTHDQLVGVGGYNEDGNMFTARVTDNEGVTSTDTATVKVYSNPIVNTGNDYVVTPGNSVTISSSGSYDPDSVNAGNGDGIVGYAWDMDNEGTFSPDSSSSSVTFTHQQLANACGYSENGNTFAARVTDNEGATSIATATVKVFSDPIADAGAIQTKLYQDQTLYLQGSGSDADGGEMTSYVWDLDGDGQYDDATGAAPEISYATLTNLGMTVGNSYTVSMKTVDNDGVYAGEDTDTFNLVLDDHYNIAGQATITASSINWNMIPGKLSDGQFDFDREDAWASVYTEPHWVKLEWDEDISFDEIRLYSIGCTVPNAEEYTTADFLIQIWDDFASDWFTIESVIDNEDLIYVFESATAFNTDAIRIYITDANYHDTAARILEIEVGSYGTAMPPVPEPVTLATLALGGTFCLRRRRK